MKGLDLAMNIQSQTAATTLNMINKVATASSIRYKAHTGGTKLDKVLSHAQTAPCKACCLDGTMSASLVHCLQSVFKSGHTKECSASNVS